MQYSRFEIVMAVFAVIGVLSLVAAGVIGMVKLVHYRTEGATAESLAAGITIPEVIAPSVPPSLPRTSSISRPPAPVPTPAPERMADLSVRIIDTGISTGGDSGFVHANVVQAGERPVIIFTVMNVGTLASDRWQFTANLPTLDGRYLSPVQQPLGPGEGRRFTLGFGELNKSGENPATVSVFSWSPATDTNPSNDANTAVLERGY